MQIKVNTVQEYINHLSPERAEIITELRNVILKNIPVGFEETITYGMIGYVVPHSLYPAGYHCNPTEPLPFINIASQKNYISLYHMGLYADSEISKWFSNKYNQLNIGKPNMGKGCIRFRKIENIPYDLIGELVGKITPQQWIDYYEKALRNH